MSVRDERCDSGGHYGCNCMPGFSDGRCEGGYHYGCSCFTPTPNQGRALHSSIIDIRRNDHEPANSNQVERDNPTPIEIKNEIDRNMRKAMLEDDKYDPNNDPWPGSSGRK